jgi:mannose/cellobiose epimerase-like protein (N-acyl-D-glucosamine 2-epimerase family)
MTSPAASVYPRFALETLLPLCRDRFADTEHGGFHEQLDPAGSPLPIGTKRVMVQCRQLYILSHSALLGDRSGAASAERGFAFMRDTFRDRRNGGWFFRATASGEPTDRTKDAYAHAFVLFSLAYLHRAFAVPDALDLARDTYDVMASRLAADNGGFWDAASETWEPDTKVRRQNPHMHLLEALHALYEATGDEAWLTEANRLVTLFRERFYEASTATLGEYFTADWSPDPDRGHIVEPGHHYEWVWLLHRHAALTGGRVDEAADALFAHAERHGFDPEHGGIHDQIDRGGRPVQQTRRIWPMTEAIKAYVARREAGLPIPAGEPDALIGRLFADFIDPAELGWIETMTRDGSPTLTNLPGSTPYHLFLSATEVARTARR